MVLVLSRRAVERLRTLAAAAAPAECCGLLIGREQGSARVVHGIEPVANAAPDAYHVPAGNFAAAEAAARASGAYVCGVYHSHPRGEPVPSPRDIALAWPGLHYVIVGAAGDVRAWRLAEDRRRFTEVPIDPGGS